MSALSSGHIQTQLNHRRKLTPDQYLDLVRQYLPIGVAAGTDLTDCFRDHGSCNSIRCAAHGHGVALNVWRVAGCIAAAAPHRYAITWLDLGDLRTFDPEHFHALVSDNVAALNDSGRQAAVIVTVELDPTGYVHAHGLLWSTHELTTCFDENVSVQKLDRNSAVPWALYLAKDLADSATRAGAFALNGRTMPKVIGPYWGPGGYKAAKSAWPYKRGQRLIFSENSDTYCDRVVTGSAEE